MHFNERFLKNHVKIINNIKDVEFNDYKIFERLYHR